MAYAITSAQLAKFAPQIPATQLQVMADAANAAMAKFGIDASPRRVRYFMAQAAYETAGFSKLVENLNYTTPERLVAVWPSRFTMNQADTSKAYAPSYVGNPQKLANLVYASRMGNGNVASGDGWLFRGRGAFHLTGRSNYTAYSQAIYGDTRVVSNPDLVTQAADLFMSAGWYWSQNGLSALADQDAYTAVTQKINGAQGEALTQLVQQRMPSLNSANAAFTW
ncbi:lytic enzyme [Burkholderia phage BcepSauron]|uniref:Lytic enzyme n=1 Tax=Burkholderia phage BcepSauron TaxID=2530033 RepID=A0A482MNA5_9CAUD|nr:endolysin [Burkholderia phage BcepSauron]QBQ74663.1 lytic enzyme [Burkholderia phage BcepSauron]